MGMRAQRQDDREVCGLKLLFLQSLLRKLPSEAIALSALEEPIRAELFSAERLEQHGESLAAAQRGWRAVEPSLSRAQRSSSLITTPSIS